MSKHREGNQNSLLSLYCVIIDHEAYVAAELCIQAIEPDYLQLFRIDALISKRINSTKSNSSVNPSRKKLFLNIYIYIFFKEINL